VAIVSKVSNGKNTIFWTDRWLHGQSLDQLVPTLFGSVNNKTRKKTVYEAITEMKWVQDIRGAITVPVLTEYEVLGSSLGFDFVIYHQRGLRQGDPLSPMLFILVMDVLNSLFTKAESEGLLQPLHSIGRRLSLYADDVALFIRPEPEDLQLTKSLLQIFGEASGMQTNLQKICVIPIHCEADYVEVINNTLSCTLSSFPSIYLGLPISDKKL